MIEFIKKLRDLSREESLKNAFKGALLFPNTVKSFALFLGLNLILSPIIAPLLAPVMLKNAKDKVKAMGVKSQTIEKLAPNKNVYFRGDDLLSQMHLLISKPHVALYFMARPLGGYSFGSVQANAKKNKLLYLIPIKNEHVVTKGWDGDDISLKDVVESFSGKSIKGKDIKEDFNISSKVISDILEIHEIVHCNDEQKNYITLEKEVDSDYKALRCVSNSDYKVAGNESKKDIITFYFNLRASNVSAGSHDVALMLDAKLNGTVVPKVEEADEANEQAKKFLNGRAKENEISDLARKRVGFYEAAMKYFMKPEVYVAPSHSVPVIEFKMKG